MLARFIHLSPIFRARAHAGMLVVASNPYFRHNYFLQYSQRQTEAIWRYKCGFLTLRDFLRVDAEKLFDYNKRPLPSSVALPLQKDILGSLLYIFAGSQRYFLYSIQTVSQGYDTLFWYSSFFQILTVTTAWPFFTRPQNLEK